MSDVLFLDGKPWNTLISMVLADVPLVIRNEFLATSMSDVLFLAENLGIS